MAIWLRILGAVLLGCAGLTAWQAVAVDQPYSLAVAVLMGLTALALIIHRPLSRYVVYGSALAASVVGALALLPQALAAAQTAQERLMAPLPTLVWATLWLGFSYVAVRYLPRETREPPSA